MSIIKRIVAVGAVLILSHAASPLPIANAAESTDFSADSFFVYTGRYGEQQFPILEYYYPSDGIAGTKFRHRKSYFAGELPVDVEYGDIFITEDEVVTTLDESTRNTYELANSTKLENVGSCIELMEIRSLTVTSKSYDAMTMPPSYALYTFHLSDEAESYHYYSFDSFGSALGMNISGAAQGDVLTFAVYKDSVIIPVVKSSEEVVGDVNSDGEFTIADVVAVQKWLLADPSAELKCWENANLCEDDRLDLFDLCMMKKTLLSIS